MRVWILNHYATPLGGKNASRHAVLGKHLARRGHDVTVFAASLSHGKQEPTHEGEFPEGARFLDEQRDGVRWRFLRTKRYENNRQRFLAMRRFGADALRSLDGLPESDVVIGSCVHPYAVEAARRIGREKGVPFVYEIRDIWPESLADVGGMSPWHPVYRLFRHLELKALRDADGVVTLLPGMTEYVARHGVAEDRVCYVPNGVDPDAFTHVTPPPERDGFLCSYFGAHGPANGLENVVDAAELLQRDGHEHIRFRLIGDGAAKGEVVRRAERAGLHNLEFLEPVVWDELRRHAAESDAFVFNLKTMPVIEKYGLSANKLFEYLVNARPVVFACSSYNDPVAESGAGLSVAPEDPRALADAVLRLSRTEHAKRRQMGARGREHVLAHHDHARLAEKLEGFLGSLVEKRTRRAA